MPWKSDQKRHHEDNTERYDRMTGMERCTEDVQEPSSYLPPDAAVPS